jgi:hypothetical protein
MRRGIDALRGDAACDTQADSKHPAEGFRSHLRYDGNSGIGTRVGSKG